MLAALALAGTALLGGCGGGKDSGAASSAPSTPASTAAAQPAKAPRKPAASAYKDPMDVATKIRKAHLGCAAPKRTESLGTGKVLCGGAANISIEFYAGPKAFAEVEKALCQMSPSTVIVADPGRRWMVTTLDPAVTKRVQKAVGGKLAKVC
jgi:hypothetical protein